MIKIEIKYPKNEIAWCSYYRRDGTPAFLITSKPTRDYYVLYKVTGDGICERVKRAKTPTELDAAATAELDNSGRRKGNRREPEHPG